MTQTLTTERLKDLTFHSSKLIFPASHEEAAAMARELLANREAQPAAYMYKDNIHADARFSLYKRFGNWSQEDINKYEITEIPLYTVPPAPEVIDEAIDRIVAPLSPEGLDEEKHHCEWHLYHDRERIRKELREYFSVQSTGEEPNEVEMGHDSYPDYVAGWNACRAAMLAAPEGGSC